MLAYLVTSGSHGDVHPYLGVGRALVQRGHEVIVMAHPYFQRDVEQAGLSHRPIGEHLDFEKIVRDPRVMDPRQGGRIILDLLMNAALDVVNTLRQEFTPRRPNVVFSHHICFGVRWLCEEMRIPLALGTVSPLVWMSNKAIVPTFQIRPGHMAEMLGRWAGPIVQRLLQLYGGRQLNIARRKAGFRPERDAFRRDFSGGDLNLGLWSDHFRPACPDDPPHGRLCGFVWYDRGNDCQVLPEGVEQFLDQGEPPVVFTLGTSSAYTPGRFFEAARESCRLLGLRGLFLTGQKEDITRQVEPYILATSYAPFSQVFPRARAVVHHGGIGTTALAIRCGCPAAIAPQAHDQFNNALIAMKLGTAVWLDRRRLDTSQVTTALKELLSSDAYRVRAQRLGARMEVEDGATRAAQWLETLANFTQDRTD